MDWDTTTIVLMIAVGGAIGAVLRYCVGQIVDSTSFPWSTFVVNIVGSFLIALIFFSIGEIMPQIARYFLFIGVFGAFTTMSTFTLETATMFFDGRITDALLNFFLNACICVLGAFAGRSVGLLF
jgi:fluoride exporter